MNTSLQRDAPDIQEIVEKLEGLSPDMLGRVMAVIGFASSLDAKNKKEAS